MEWENIFDNHICDKGIALVRILQRNRSSRMCVYMYKDIYFKDLAYAITEAGKFKICRMCCQAGDHGRAGTQLKAEDCWLTEFLLTVCSIKTFI